MRTLPKLCLSTSKGHLDRLAFIKQVVQGVQAKLKEVQITTALAMEDLMPAVAQCLQPKIDHPVVGQTGGDHQGGQPVGEKGVTEKGGTLKK